MLILTYVDKNTAQAFIEAWQNEILQQNKPSKLKSV